VGLGRVRAAVIPAISANSQWLAGWHVHHRPDESAAIVGTLPERRNSPLQLNCTHVIRITEGESPRAIEFVENRTPSTADWRAIVGVVDQGDAFAGGVG